MNTIRAICLDLDDTLWETAPVIRRAERALRDWLQQHYPRVVEQFSPMAAFELRRRVVADWPDRVHDLTFLRCEVIRRMASSAGYADIDVDAAFAVFDEVRNDLELFPDVRPALVSIGRRYPIIAVTNGNARLDKVGIADLFSGYVSARNAGAAKPSRTIFDKAVEAGGARAAETLHVGDHPEHDIDGAREAGLQTTWVNRLGADWPGHLAGPDSVVTDLAELDRLLPGDG